MKSREIACEYYNCEGSCSKGKEGTFWHSCQHCGKYSPRRGTRPARVDTRRRKAEKIMRKESQDY